MLLRLSVAALSLGSLWLAACAQEPALCLQLSKEKAIRLARESKKDLRFNEEEQRKYVSDEVREVELRTISEGDQIGAIVTFRGDGTEAPKGLLYGDCDVEWSATKVTA
ncbi:MAG: hypothetical protein V4696_13650 [Pseudomonadota bacterium]